MRIRDVTIEAVAAGKNWRLKSGGDTSPNIVDWEIEECSAFRSSDTVVYSALAVFETGEVRPLLVIREIGTYEWWGDTCEYIDGAWRELGQTAQTNHWKREEYVASPLDEDPSFMGEYSHEAQRAGFTRWRDHLPRTYN
jgi:hypothetical protein